MTLKFKARTLLIFDALGISMNQLRNIRSGGMKWYRGPFSQIFTNVAIPDAATTQQTNPNINTNGPINNIGQWAGGCIQLIGGGVSLVGQGISQIGQGIGNIFKGLQGLANGPQGN